MKKIMILTSMRTGSTWLTFLVKYLYRRNAGFARDFETVDSIWKGLGFVKAHIFTPEEVFKRYPDVYIITSVRNPKGRVASQFYFQKPYSNERLDKIIKASLSFGEQKQLNRMWKGYSSKQTLVNREPKYLWTAYEWMRENIYREAEIICDFLEIKRTPVEIKVAINKAQEESKYYGVLRKGIVGGWKEEKFSDKLLVLDKYQKMYYNIINKEE